MICSMKSIQQSKLKETVKNLAFGTLDHSKMHFCDFWMIQHEQYHGQTVNIIYYYLDMQ